MERVNVVDAVIDSRISKKGQEYHVLKIAFENGYTTEFFINNEQFFCINLNKK